jgi:hypothetical protein
VREAGRSAKQRDAERRAQCISTGTRRTEKPGKSIERPAVHG